MPPKNKPKQSRKKRAPQTAILVPEVFCGESIVHQKNIFNIGHTIGQGGFGRIYLASNTGLPRNWKDALQVAKIERKDSGPLFCEMNCYQRCGRISDVESWVKCRKLRHFAFPRFYAAGIHNKDSVPYRYIILDRYGTCLQTIFDEKKRFPRQAVCQMAVQMINVLEYIHSKQYVHADLKAGNILMGYSKQDAGYPFLVDFGLAEKIRKGYHPRADQMHNGTREYTSRDAHDGAAPSMRGDLEILGYCLMQWSSSRLPWEGNPDHEYIASRKHYYMKNLSKFMADSFRSSQKPPGELLEFLTVVNKCDYDEAPNYSLCVSIFTKGLKSIPGNHGAYDKINFDGVCPAEESVNIPPKIARLGQAVVESPVVKKLATPGSKRKSDSPDTRATKYTKSDNDSPTSLPLIPVKAKTKPKTVPKKNKQVASTKNAVSNLRKKYSRIRGSPNKSSNFEVSSTLDSDFTNGDSHAACSAERETLSSSKAGSNLTMVDQATQTSPKRKRRNKIVGRSSRTSKT